MSMQILEIMLSSSLTSKNSSLMKKERLDWCAIVKIKSENLEIKKEDIRLSKQLNVLSLWLRHEIRTVCVISESDQVKSQSHSHSRWSTFDTTKDDDDIEDQKWNLSSIKRSNFFVESSFQSTHFRFYHRSWFCRFEKFTHRQFDVQIQRHL
jgi:hypothetical protein